MGWIFAIVLFVIGSIRGDAGVLIAAGLFGIAGAVGSVAVGLKGEKGSGDGDSSSGVAK